MFVKPVTQNPITALGTIEAVKLGQELTKAHIDYFVGGVVANARNPKTGIPPYQAAAFLMAVRLNGMTDQETIWLTRAMTNSGKCLNLARVGGFTVDKHSTGGISDGTSFVVAPLVAQYGLKVPMMSGRSLGHTGGTLDKLESIPGFRVALTQAKIVAQLNRIGLAIFGQTKDIAPADKVFYGLRDVTSTVDSIPLIAASIMSKKLAEGAKGLVMNVTTGTGAFMRELADAEQLARTMVAIAHQSGRKASAVISNMDQPLAPYVGNSLEIAQTVRVLRGETDRFERFIAVSIELAAHLLVHGGIYLTDQMDTAKADLRAKLASGAALATFRDMVTAQGGDVGVIDDLSQLPTASRTVDVLSTDAGYVAAINATQIGWSSVYLGAGREKADDRIDPAVGIKVFKFIGDKVSQGEPLARLHVNNDNRLEEAKRTLSAAYTLGEQRVEPRPLILGVC